MLNVEAVQKLIQLHISGKVPFSLIRLGDGEARLIGYPRVIDAREMRRSLAYWYGPFVPTHDEVLALKEEVIQAARNADVLGLPEERRAQKYHLCALMLRLVSRYELGQNWQCGSDVHRELVTTGSLGELIGGQARVSVITCRNVVQGLKHLYNIGEVAWYQVPSEAQATMPRKRHYPDQHDRLLKILRCEPGEIFLIGAGPNGKVYCNRVKQLGGIALDIGSVFDGWAGIASRSYLHREAEKYRL